MQPVLNLLYLIAAALFTPVLLVRIIAQGKYRRGWRERFGRLRPRPGTRPCIWVHAVSLGEINATRTLVAEIARRLPKYEIVISTTTQTGYDAALKHYSPLYVFRYPLDFSWMVRRAWERIRPNLVVLMELEVWPNFMAEAARRGVPVVVVNGRVTEEKSMRRFRWPVLRGVARSMFSRLTTVAAQDDQHAARFRELGVAADRVVVTGTMKYDTALVADTVDGADLLARAMNIEPGTPLLVAGSTGPGEEETLLGLFDRLRAALPALQLAIIPRKPERFDEVARLIEARGFACVRRTEHPDLRGQDARAAEQERRRREAMAKKTAAGTPVDPASSDAGPPAVYLGDTMGELRKFYSLAAVVFVGRTLVPMGGSDVMEVAGLARPMVLGPHTENFADAVSRLVAAGGAAQAADAAAVGQRLAGLLASPAEAAAMGQAARQVVLQNVGATRRTVDLLCNALQLRADHPTASIATRRVGGVSSALHGAAAGAHVQQLDAE